MPNSYAFLLFWFWMQFVLTKEDAIRQFIHLSENVFVMYRGKLSPCCFVIGYAFIMLGLMDIACWSLSELWFEVRNVWWILMDVMHFYLTAIQTRLQAQAAGVSYHGLCRMAPFETVSVHNLHGSLLANILYWMGQLEVVPLLDSCLDSLRCK